MQKLVNDRFSAIPPQEATPGDTDSLQTKNIASQLARSSLARGGPHFSLDQATYFALFPQYSPILHLVLTSHPCPNISD